jgi:oligoendopeptidase F
MSTGSKSAARTSFRGDVEQVLALAGDPFSGAFSIFNMLNNADLKFQPATGSDGTQHEIGQSSIGSLLTHPDRQVRRSAWQNYADGYLAFKNTSAATLTTAIKQDVFNARVRRYPARCTPRSSRTTSRSRSSTT